MIENRTFHPGPSPNSSRDPDTLFDPATMGDDLPPAGTVRTTAGPTASETFRRDVLRPVGAGMRNVLTSDLLFQAGLTITCILGIDAVFGLSWLLIDDALMQARLSAALGVGMGAGLAWRAIRSRYTEAYSRVHLVALVIGLIALAGFIPEGVAHAIALPFMAGYGGVSLLVIATLALIPIPRPASDTPPDK